jgi:hypothetical protein
VPAFPTNDAGQTFGSCADVLPSDYPDLVAVIGQASDGQRVTGYVLATELREAEGGNVRNPEEAIAWMRAQEQRPPTRLSVYSRDGTTVLGSFTQDKGRSSSV